jgi:hypothetical protein
MNFRSVSTIPPPTPRASPNSGLIQGRAGKICIMSSIVTFLEYRVDIFTDTCTVLNTVKSVRAGRWMCRVVILPCVNGIANPGGADGWKQDNTVGFRVGFGDMVN